MATSHSATTLNALLDRLEEAGPDGAGDRPVKLGELLDAVGRRSFGPILLLVGLIAVSPLSGIPGMPSILGITVILVAGQLVVGRERFWVPGWVSERAISRGKLDRALKFLRRPAVWVDRVLRERLAFLTRGIATYAIALLSVLIAATMPPLEIVPFAASTAGLALMAFGLALTAHDGVMALAAVAFTLATGTWMVMQIGD